MAAGHLDGPKPIAAVTAVDEERHAHIRRSHLLDEHSGRVFLEFSPPDLTKALQAGVLVEVKCGELAH